VLLGGEGAEVEEEGVEVVEEEGAMLVGATKTVGRK
jgi:hypothetical protein